MTITSVITKTLAILWSLVAIAVFTAVAQSPESLAARLDNLRAEGYEALYNLDYAGAREHFRQMVQIAPDNPAGPQCMAASLWLQQLNASWELKATFYSDSSHAPASQNFNSPRALEFHKWTRQAKQLSQARLRKDPRDPEALYFLGAAEGLEAAFAAAVERKFMSALRSGSDSVEHHRALLKIAPEFRDAELTIGLYDYVIGNLPLPLKILAGTTGVRGSKKRGLQTMEKVSIEGHWARDLARILLIDLYKREKRWSDAVKTSRDLSVKYPRNYLFKLQLADALTSRAMTPSLTSDNDKLEALGIFESLLQSDKSGKSSVIHFRYGETLLLLGNPASALKEFQWVASYNLAEAGLQNMSRLRLAQCLDLLGKRREAIATYRLLLGPQNGAQVQDEARRGLREPFTLHKLR